MARTPNSGGEIKSSTTGEVADSRLRLGMETTLLIWIRTGLALMGFGFVLARFGLFLEELAGAAISPAAVSRVVVVRHPAYFAGGHREPADGVDAFAVLASHASGRDRFAADLEIGIGPGRAFGRGGRGDGRALGGDGPVARGMRASAS